jgi:hypothetical protein
MSKLFSLYSGRRFEEQMVSIYMESTPKMKNRSPAQGEEKQLCILVAISKMLMNPKP